MSAGSLKSLSSAHGMNGFAHGHGSVNGIPVPFSERRSSTVSSDDFFDASEGLDGESNVHARGHASSSPSKDLQRFFSVYLPVVSSLHFFLGSVVQTAGAMTILLPRPVPGHGGRVL